ncbi:MAG: hypothetical protein ACUVWK_05200 [Nitrososphaerales archaeon]
MKRKIHLVSLSLCVRYFLKYIRIVGPSRIDDIVIPSLVINAASRVWNGSKDIGEVSICAYGVSVRELPRWDPVLRYPYRSII